MLAMPARHRLLRLVLLLAVALVGAGCGSTGDKTEAVPESETPQAVEIFYVTNRAQAAGQDHFGAERGELSFGTAAVGIPPGHAIGRHERPSVFRFEWSPDERKHIALKEVTPLDRDTFYQRLAFAINLAPERNLLLFVHGYNVGFTRAAERVAQFATDLKFTGPVLLFSWPSRDSLTGYTVDENNAEWSQGHLLEVMNDLLDLTPSRKIFLVAHSMGSRIVTGAYNTLSAERLVYGPNPYREMVLVAPDIDADLFRRDIAPRLAANGIHVTLYASSGDRALMASHAFHGYPRAGDSGEGLVITPGVETVDASDASAGFLGHSYFAEDRRIMEDIYGVLYTGQRAEERFGLEGVDTPEGRYWTFRK